MTKSPLKNIPLRIFRQYLAWNGLERIRTKGGHEVWSKKGMKRPVVLPTHEDPVYEFVAKNALINMNVDVNNYIEFLES
jgi:predicted RNA binding protein YcfA (HicA-like mRNA interferase family)